MGKTGIREERCIEMIVGVFPKYLRGRVYIGGGIEILKVFGIKVPQEERTIKSGNELAICTQTLSRLREMRTDIWSGSNRG